MNIEVCKRLSGEREREREGEGKKEIIVQMYYVLSCFSRFSLHFVSI